MKRVGNLINKEEELCKVYSVRDCASMISMLAQAKYADSSYLYKNVGRMLNIPQIKHIKGENVRKKMKGFSYIYIYQM